MRKLIWIIIVLAGLFCGWWMLASATVERGLATWVGDRRAEGWQAELTALPVTGFPTRFDLVLNDLALADPATGLALRMQGLQLTARSYWPGDVAVTLPQTPIEFSTPDARLTVTAKEAKAALRLHPGPTLELDQMVATSGAWQLDGPAGNLLQASDADAEITQGAKAETYRFALSAGQLVPGGLIRTALRLPVDWPLAFDAFAADVTIIFDAPLNRYTLEDRRPQPREIEAKRIDFHWGPLRLNATGRLAIDPTGVAEGEVKLLVENWRSALDLAEQSGAMADRLRPQAELMLNALANMGDNPETLDLTLGFRDGGMFLGPISLGPAPHLILR